LISGGPDAAALADHAGTSPQRSQSALRASPCARTASTSWPGAML
jgi:hypothetical protein